jgi:hypothetical protein
MAFAIAGVGAAGVVDRIELRDETFPSRLHAGRGRATRFEQM